MEDYKDIVEEEKKYKPKLFTFPNWEEGCAVFDFEELMPENLLVLCVKATHDPDQAKSDRHRVYIWRGAEFFDEEEEMGSVKDFINKSMEQYWGCS